MDRATESFGFRTQMDSRSPARRHAATAARMPALDPNRPMQTGRAESSKATDEETSHVDRGPNHATARMQAQIRGMHTPASPVYLQMSRIAFDHMMPTRPCQSAAR